MALEKLLTVEDLALILERATGTIKNQHSKNPSKLPPLCRLPGAKRLLWRREDVECWLQQHVVRLDKTFSTSAVIKRKPGRPLKSEHASRTVAERDSI